MAATPLVPNRPRHFAHTLVWAVATLSWVAMTQPGGSGGGDASAANQVTGNASVASIDTKTPALGQALAASSTPVVLTAAQITTLTPLTAVQANAGTNLNTSALNLEATQALVKAKTDNLDVALSTRLKPADTLAAVTSITNVVHVDDNAGSLTVDGTVTANAGTGTFATKEVRSATPAQSSPSVTNSNTVILASNANRLGATIYNESGAIALVKLGATASITSYSVSVAIGGYYEVPFGYTGAIDGITASGTAVLRVTELAA